MPHSAEVVRTVQYYEIFILCANPVSYHAAVWNSTKSSMCGGGSPSLTSGIAASIIVVIGPGKLTFATD